MLSERISSCRVYIRSVLASVPDTDALCSHQFLTRTLSAHISSLAHDQHVVKDLFKFGMYAYAENTRKKLKRMLRLRISSWFVCSVNASVPDAYMLSMFWRDCAQKIRLSIRVRNFAAPNEPLRIFNFFLNLNPTQSRKSQTSWQSERSKVSYLGTVPGVLYVFLNTF